MFPPTGLSSYFVVVVATYSCGSALSTRRQGGKQAGEGKKKQGKESVPRLLFSLDRIHGTWRADAAIYAAHAR